MKKLCCILIASIICTMLFSACNLKAKEATMVQAKRRFAKYVEPQQKKSEGGRVDLSEGPHLRYDADFGPKNPSFEFKIVNPY